MAGTSVTLGGNNLQTATIITNNVDHHSMPEIDAKQYPFAHAPGSTIPFTNFPSKTIPLTGTLSAASITAMDALVDTFKAYFLGTNLNLDIGYNGGTRRYQATANTPVKIVRPGGLQWGTYSAQLVCNNPFGMDTTSTAAVTAAGRTLSTYSDTFTFTGTAPWQLPVATFTFSVLTGGTNGQLTWGNAATGQAITIIRTWAATDVLVIDSTQSSVTVNGATVSFFGAFPTFPPGSGTMAYVDTFTTRTFSIAVTYTAYYL